MFMPARRLHVQYNSMLIATLFGVSNLKTITRYDSPKTHIRKKDEVERLLFSNNFPFNRPSVSN